MRRFLVVIGLTLGFFLKVEAQKSQRDTTYVFSQADKLVTRFYLSRKFTDFRVWDPVSGSSIRFLPNSGHNVGFGASFQKVTLNIAFPFAPLNPYRQVDFPRFLDLQSHLYLTKWMIDFFGQFYKGYTIRDFEGESVIRRDMKLQKIGFLANYLFEGQKISLQAAAQQSAVQLRSAFSPTVGLEVYRVWVGGDSLILPTEANFTSNFSQADYYHLGPNAGFLGTWVLGKGLFLTGSIVANLGAGYARWDSDRSTSVWELVPGFSGRIFAGYNGDKLAINANYVYKNLRLAHPDNLHQSTNTGNYRLNLVYKFDALPWNKKSRKLR